jgi:CHAT domain-containing protein
VIIADGALQRLPFSLFDEAPSSHDYIYLPSFRTLRLLRTAISGRRAHGTQIAILADPVFAADDPRLAKPAVQEAVALHQSVGRAARAAGLDALPRLLHSREEALGLAALMPADRSVLKLDFAASRELALKTDWSPYRIVHFATHALLDLDTPEQSGVVLSLYDTEGRPQDGFLRANDIYRLEMPVDLVVLSACESALQKASGSEDSFNLARAFFYAGAHRVLASLWTVDDRASAEFMHHFYKALLVDGRSPDEALRAAQNHLAADPRWTAPYYWAGYVLQGDWRDGGS